MQKNISILGSTGSIGVSTLDIVRRHPDKFKVCALAAGKNVEVLATQIKEFSPSLVSVHDDEAAKKLTTILGRDAPHVEVGQSGAIAVATLSEVQIVMSAIVGAAGLLPTLMAIRRGKTIALANKESMVIAGEIMRAEANKSGIEIIPVDSEHSAIYQCLQGNPKSKIKKLILTASGGPFRNWPKDDFSKITVQQALQHPNWSMGHKITIDSATMMNKGFEVMEAVWLFDVPLHQVEVCVHPQSIIHSMVEYCDGSVMAQMGAPDMRVPIAYALSDRDRIETGSPTLDLFQQKELTFYKPDLEKFRCLAIAFEVAQKAQTYPAVLNAANEVLVDSFLNGKLSFVDIPRFLDRILDLHQPKELDVLETVLEADSWARRMANELLQRKT